MFGLEDARQNETAVAQSTNQGLGKVNSILKMITLIQKVKREFNYKQLKYADHILNLDKQISKILTKFFFKLAI